MNSFKILSKKMPDKPPFIRFVCEGKVTEPNYFNQLLLSKNLKIPVAAFQPKDHSPLGLVREAKKLYKEVKNYYEANKILICTIFDCDGHSGIPDAIKALQDSPIKHGFSNICFEYWSLLHYERTTRSFKNKEEIRHFIKITHDPNYSDINLFKRLESRNSFARLNAKWVCDTYWQYEERPIWERNPYTNLHDILKAIDDIISG